jgi:hypothetical protein
MAEELDKPPLKDLYRKLITDSETSPVFRKYSFTQFRDRMINNPDASGEVADYLIGEGIIKDREEWKDDWVLPSVPKPVAPVQKQQPAQSQQPSPQPRSFTDITREQIAYREPVSLAPPVPQTLTEQTTEQVVTPMADQEFSRDETQRVRNEKRSTWEKLKDVGMSIGASFDNMYTKMQIGERYLAEAQKKLFKGGYFGNEDAAKDENEARQKLAAFSQKIDQQYANAEWKRNIKGSVLDAIEKGQWNLVPEAVVKTIADAALQIVPTMATGGYSMYIQTLPDAYISGVKEVAEKTGRTPQQVIESGDDGMIVANLSAGLQAAMEKASAGIFSKTIATQGGYKSLRDWLVNKGLPRLAASGTALGTQMWKESAIELGQELVGMSGEQLTASKDWNDFKENLWKEIQTPEGTRRLKESAVGGLVGAGGLIGGGRFIQSWRNGTLINTPTTGKTEKRGDFNAVIAADAIDSRAALQRQKLAEIKANPNNANEIAAKYDAEIAKIKLPTFDQAADAYTYISERVGSGTPNQMQSDVLKTLENYLKNRGIESKTEDTGEEPIFNPMSKTASREPLPSQLGGIPMQPAEAIAETETLTDDGKSRIVKVDTLEEVPVEKQESVAVVEADGKKQYWYTEPIETIDVTPQSETDYVSVTPEELQTFTQGQVDPERLAGVQEDAQDVIDGELSLNQIDDPNYREMVRLTVVANGNTDTGTTSLNVDAGTLESGGTESVAVNADVVPGPATTEALPVAEGGAPAVPLPQVEQTQQAEVGETNKGADNKIELSLTRGGFVGDILNDYDLIGEGSEHTVYRSKDGSHVIKISEPYNDKSESTFNARIKDATLISEIIGDGSLEVVGYYESQNGTKNPIYRQDFQEGTPLSEKDVVDYLKSIGAVEFGGKYDKGYLVSRNGKWYKISDLTDNFFKNKDGKIFAIDAGIQEVSNDVVLETYNKAKQDGSNPELVKAVEDLIQPTNAEPVPVRQPTPTPASLADQIADLRAKEQAEYDAMPDPKDKAKRKEIYDRYDKPISDLLAQQEKEGFGSLRDVELTMRRPEKNEIVFVPIDALLEKQAADQPSYDIQKEENRIKGRVEKAKEFLKNYLKDQRAINPKTGKRTNAKVSFEPSIVDVDANGKISFEDGRHRVLAAKELGLTEVPIEVPKGKGNAIQESLKQQTTETKGKESPKVIDRNATQALLDQANDELTAAKSAFDKKRAELNKTTKEDATDLFGKRKVESGQGLFEMPRISPQQREKAIQPFRDRFEKAKKEVNRLTTLLNKGQEITQKLNFENDEQVQETGTEVRKGKGGTKDEGPVRKKNPPVRNAGRTPDAIAARNIQFFGDPYYSSLQYMMDMTYHPDLLQSIFGGPDKNTKSGRKNIEGERKPRIQFLDKKSNIKTADRLGELLAEKYAEDNNMTVREAEDKHNFRDIAETIILNHSSRNQMVKAILDQNDMVEQQHKFQYDPEGIYGEDFNEDAAKDVDNSLDDIPDSYWEGMDLTDDQYNELFVPEGANETKLTSVEKSGQQNTTNVNLQNEKSELRSPFTAFEQKGEDGRKARAALKEKVGKAQFAVYETVNRDAEKILRDAEKRGLIKIDCP